MAARFWIMLFVFILRSVIINAVSFFFFFLKIAIKKLKKRKSFHTLSHLLEAGRREE